ncbi:malate synthase A [Marinithermus hydrothermalis]|uniref:Malate synthase n=1 Tax=Marinithermus hydrothermalis (strain DSM 14884 / JCM 11576 / T1) TaxID=869210 RepID=F2NQM5_MARHT|nr:malate synthase A [Marinithermus hydrothermalis]AEB11963.1 malate synthase [Marinithermus hydrothermalis DSM 14884]
MPEVTTSGIEVRGAPLPEAREVLTPEALAFVAALQREFGEAREALLAARAARQAALDAGEMLDFLPETRSVREANWRVADCPEDLRDRRVEITGPAERKMMINALNSGANAFMADLEDALAPTWGNVVRAQKNLIDAVRRRLEYTSPEGKVYRLKERLATLIVRPRGWHLEEKHVWVDGRPVSASLFDFGLFFYHNAQALLERGSGPYFYLPKLEGHREARLWNEVFNFAQDRLGIPRGSVRATVLIETLPAAFEMEEILYELKEHAAGLNAGRWDYIFSCIKRLRASAPLFPDRAQVTMTVPFMRAYTELLVRTCHKRGAHAIGGMAAFVPSRKRPEVNAQAFAKVREDKEREASQGFDGTWVAHPDLVPVAREAFDQRLGERPHQKDNLREDVRVTAQDLLDFRVPEGRITEEGLRNNVSVALQYLNAWLSGTGAVAIHHLMEDAATAEIARAQLWQWVHRGAVLADGRAVTPALYRQVREEELTGLGGPEIGRYREAAEVLDRLVLNQKFHEFLTLVAYEYLE